MNRKHFTVIDIAITALVMGGTVALVLMHEYKTAPVPITAVEQDDTGMYLKIPGGGKVYKFYDEVGAICFAMTESNGTPINLECMQVQLEPPHVDGDAEVVPNDMSLKEYSL